MKIPHLMSHLDEASSLLAILGNTKRLLIMCHLLEQEMSVGKIADSVDLSQSALSQHLAKLRQMSLVKTRRDKQTIYYSCACERVRGLIMSLERIYDGADRGLTTAGLEQRERAS